MRTLKNAFVLIICCCAFWARPASGSTVIYRTDAELIARSERVVHARVVAQRTTWDGPQKRSIYTVTTLAVLEDFTGQPGTTIDVWELGGVVGNEFMFVGGAVEYTLGEEVVVCLERGPYGYRSVAMNLSKFDVVGSASGNATLRRRMADTVVIGGGATRERSLSGFRELAARVTGRQPWRNEQQQDLQVAEQPYTHLTLPNGKPVRWIEADSNLPITYYRNTSAAAPLVSGGDGTSEIETALSAWTTPAAASIGLQYGGTAFETKAKGPFDTLIGPVGLITFEDPNNELSGLTLAVGGGVAVEDQGGTINGLLYSEFTRAYVIFRKAADLDSFAPEFRQSLDFTRVLTHEIGHTIGLGHTQEDGSVANPTSNIMFATCCNADTPVPPALGADDLTGLGAIYPVSPTCTYSITPTSAPAPVGGTTGNVTVTTQAGCGWTATSNDAFLSITSGSGGSGSGTVAYSVAGNGFSQRTGTMMIANHTFTVVQSGIGPSMTIDKTSLNFGAAVTGATVTAQTSAQTIRMTQSGAGTITWTATPSQPWLQITPSSGTGSANFSITVSPSGLPAGTVTGSIAIALSGAGNTVGPIAVSLAVKPTGTTLNPVGTVDTPANNITGVTGAIPFTGWALDDIEVTSAIVCRGAFAGEAPGLESRCGGNAQFYVGDAVFIDGARPDVQATFPTYPRESRGGWGFMVLTNMLPSQGNGTYQFFMYATDREGHSVLLGSRTITCDNAHATKPFGAIDTPTQGGLASGSSFVNFGWALTQFPKSIPMDGSTIQVLIDGAGIGTVDYNHFRSDIATLFPNLMNSNGAIGFRILDTTALTNGLHTIVWLVADDSGAFEGIGSRFFTVSNGVGAVTAAAVADDMREAAAIDAAARSEAVAAAPHDDTPVLGRRGWDLDGPWRWFAVGAAGRSVIRGEEIDRFELWLGAQTGQTYRGYLRVGNALAPMPAGSRLDATSGWFTWAPGVGFVGTYDLVFVRWAGTQALARHEVRVILAPKGRGHVGAQVEIDTPRAQQQVTQPFLLGGWVADLDAAAGTGIDTVHVWAYPAAGGPPVFLGTPALGGIRPDVAAVHGDQFRAAGFNLAVQALAPGTYDLAVFPWSNVTNAFAPPKTVRVTVE
jgi:hypothetical protein